MKPKINAVFSLVEDWHPSEIRRLIAELEMLSEQKENLIEIYD